MTSGPWSIADLDGTDLAILKRAGADFDASLETLVVELDISESTVYYWINELKENGVIRGVTADVDPRSLGLEMVAITGVSVTHETGYSGEVGAELDALVGVGQVYYTMGDIDFVIISRAQSREQLSTLINRMMAIDGVSETSSKFVMQEFENDRRYVSNLSEKARTAVINPSNDTDG